MLEIPRLRLTHGQVAWAICQGREPDDQTLDALRYLRQLGVPFAKHEQGVGRGNRMTFTFDHLVECAVAMFAGRHGVKPGIAAQFLKAERTKLRKLYRESFRDCGDGSLTADWVRSRGAIVPHQIEEQYIRLHERYDEPGGKVELMTLDEVLSYKGAIGDMVERYGHRVYPLIPLRRVMLEAVAWALEAPVTPPGRPSKLSLLTATLPAHE